MSSLKVLEPLFRFLPEVKSPVHHEDFNEKLKWTALILVLYFILTDSDTYFSFSITLPPAVQANLYLHLIRPQLFALCTHNLPYFR